MKLIAGVLTLILCVALSDAQAEEAADFKTEFRFTAFSNTHGGFTIELAGERDLFYVVRLLWRVPIPPSRAENGRDFGIVPGGPAKTMFQFIGTGVHSERDVVELPAATSAAQWQGPWVAFYIGGPGLTTCRVGISYAFLASLKEAGQTEMMIVVEGQSRKANKTAAMRYLIPFDRIPPPLPPQPREPGRRNVPPGGGAEDAT